MAKIIQKSSINYTAQKGVSLAIVIALIAVISAIILPMARTTILEEKITQNHDWLNLIYNEARGEVYRQSSSDTTKIDELLQAMENQTSLKKENLENHLTEIKYRDQNGIPFGYSIDRFRGFQFDVVTEADVPSTGGYNQQNIGITYVARGN